MFYTSLFFGHAEDVKVALKMYERMQNDGIPVGKMVTLVQDGPNVNKAIFKKMKADTGLSRIKRSNRSWILYHSHSTQCFWERH